jgi:hypothetical protein
MMNPVLSGQKLSVHEVLGFEIVVSGKKGGMVYLSCQVRQIFR